MQVKLMLRVEADDARASVGYTNRGLYALYVDGDGHRAFRWLHASQVAGLIAKLVKWGESRGGQVSHG